MRNSLKELLAFWGGLGYNDDSVLRTKKLKSSSVKMD